jgi:hypothetical protein
MADVLDWDNIPYVEPAKHAWPAVEGEDKYPHLTNFMVYDGNTNELVDLRRCGVGVELENDIAGDSSSSSANDRGSFFCVGYLMPPVGSGKTEILTQFPVKNYAIDFGHDENRGFWLEDIHDKYYKLEEPHKSYEVLSNPAIQFANEFCTLMDVIHSTDPNGVPYGRMHAHDYYTCNKSLEFLCQATNQSFDMDLMMSMGSLLYTQLKGTRLKENCTLMKSVDPVRR